MTAIVTESFTLKEIESTILLAHQKVKTKNLNELCQYLPNRDGYRMHHFVLRKLKRDNPENLKKLINKYILETEVPQKIKSSPRKKKEAKKQSLVNLEISELQVLIKLAEQSDHSELVAKLRSNLPFSLVQKEMLKCIQEERIDMNLWAIYVETIKDRNANQD